MLPTTKPITAIAPITNAPAHRWDARRARAASSSGLVSSKAKEIRQPGSSAPASSDSAEPAALVGSISKRTLREELCWSRYVRIAASIVEVRYSATTRPDFDASFHVSFGAELVSRY